MVGEELWGCGARFAAVRRKEVWVEWLKIWQLGGRKSVEYVWKFVINILC